MEKCTKILGNNLCLIWDLMTSYLPLDKRGFGERELYLTNHFDIWMFTHLVKKRFKSKVRDSSQVTVVN